MNRHFKVAFSITLLTMAVVVASGIFGLILFVIFENHGLISSPESVNLWLVILAFLILLFFIALIITRLLTMRLVKPVETMIDATNKIAKGDFDVRIAPFDSRLLNETELATLRDSINTMARELKNNELFKTDFINNFTHEFKTPINCILGFAKQLKKKDVTRQQIEEYSEIIIKESGRLSALSSNVLLLAKLENRSIDLVETIVNVDETIRDCIIVLQPAWERKNIEWNLDFNGRTTKCNADLLKQVFLNVLSNAIKFSYDGGIIDVKTISDDGTTILIQDHGIGMSEHDLHHVFEKFYQGDQSHSTTGNGLGLPLVETILKSMNGTIDIESELNKGCKVTIHL